MPILLKLFYEFFITGLFAIGGGLATLPFLRDMGEKTGWFTSEDLANVLAISESTPGPIGVNMATFVGYDVAGILGAIVATLGLITAPTIICIIVAKILLRFYENRKVLGALYGLRPASIGLISAACLYVVSVTFFYEGFSAEQVLTALQMGEFFNIFNWKAGILAIVVSIFAIFVKKTKGLHPIIYIGISAIIGIIFEFSVI